MKEKMLIILQFDHKQWLITFNIFFLFYFFCIFFWCCVRALYVYTVSPTVKAVNQLVGAPVESRVLLQCVVEVFPKPLNGWYRNDGNVGVIFLLFANSSEKVFPFFFSLFFFIFIFHRWMVYAITHRQR